MRRDGRKLGRFSSPVLRKSGGLHHAISGKRGKARLGGVGALSDTLLQYLVGAGERADWRRKDLTESAATTAWAPGGPAASRLCAVGHVDFAPRKRAAEWPPRAPYIQPVPSPPRLQYFHNRHPLDSFPPLLLGNVRAALALSPPLTWVSPPPPRCLSHWPRWRRIRPPRCLCCVFFGPYRELPFRTGHGSTHPSPPLFGALCIQSNELILAKKRPFSPPLTQFFSPFSGQPTTSDTQYSANGTVFPFWTVPTVQYSAVLAKWRASQHAKPHTHTSLQFHLLLSSCPPVPLLSAKG